MNINPYESPEPTANDAVAGTQPRPRGGIVIRVIIYTHVAAVGLTGIAMTHDIRSVIWPEWLHPLLGLALAFGFCAFWVCPIALLVAVSRSSLPRPRRIAILCVDGAIALTHFVALIPSLQ